MAKAAVRRLMAELRELTPTNASEYSLFHAQPLESDIFEWHFTIRGPASTAFEGGIYHGRILLPPDYPLRAPEIILLTPNGRFEVGKRICLSVTSHHQETWQPSWGIRTILTALIAFMPSRAEGVGALDYPDEDRRRLARVSALWKCDRCGVVCGEALKPVPDGVEVGGVGVGEEIVRELLGEGISGNKKKGESSGAGSSEDAASKDNEAIETESSEPQATDPEPPGPVTSEQSSELQTSEEQTNGLEEREAPAAPVGTHIAQQTQASTTGAVARRRSGTQERELLYLAYAIAGLIVAVILRRIFRLTT